MSFLNSKCKQFDGEKEYCKFQLQHRNITNTGFKPPKELQLAFTSKNHAITWLYSLLRWNKCQFAAKHMQF